MIERKLKYEARMMLGRLASGLQGGHGSRVHALEPNTTSAYGRGKALCGAQPGKRSCGWSSIEKGYPISCPKCLKKIGSKSFLETTTKSEEG